MGMKLLEMYGNVFKIDFLPYIKWTATRKSDLNILLILTYPYLFLTARNKSLLYTGIANTGQERENNTVM